LFDFLNDAIIGFKWNTSSQLFEKMKNENALYHVFKLRRDEHENSTSKVENKAIQEEVNRMISIKK